jgi:hypothetical protein
MRKLRNSIRSTSYRFPGMENLDDTVDIKKVKHFSVGTRAHAHTYTRFPFRAHRWQTGIKTRRHISKYFLNNPVLWKAKEKGTWIQIWTAQTAFPLDFSKPHGLPEKKHPQYKMSAWSNFSDIYNENFSRSVRKLLISKTAKRNQKSEITCDVPTPGWVNWAASSEQSRLRNTALWKLV